MTNEQYKNVMIGISVAIVLLLVISCGKVEKFTQHATFDTIEDCMKLCHPYGVKELDLDSTGVKCECQRKE